MKTLLFFNDWSLCRIDNMRIRQGKPEPVPEATFLDSHVDIAWGYPSVFQDKESGRWRMIYQGHYSDRKYYPLVAESTDGVAWSILDVSDRCAIPDRKFPHQILPKGEVGEIHIAYYDQKEEAPAKRLKLLIDAHSHPGFATSPDGIHWTVDSSVRWHRNVSDPAASVFYVPHRDMYTISVRPRSNDRRVCFIETRDWREFSAPSLVMEPDALDVPLTQCYGMPIFPVGELFVGFLWLYRTEPRSAPFKFYDGKVDCQLVFSRNGSNFFRFLREPFLGDEEPGQFGAGCIYPSSLVRMADGSFRIYSSAAKGEHATIYAKPESRQGAILLHTLRRDGFAFLETEGGTGEIVSRQLWITGDRLEINFQAPQGEIRVELLDNQGNPLPGYELDRCVPAVGDHTAWEPLWADGKRFDSLGKGKVVMLRVRIDRGRLYAIRGDFQVVYPSQVRELEKTGDIRSFMDGF